METISRIGWQTGKVKCMLANAITASRMLFSLVLLAFSPISFAFAAFYLLCGVTDVLDGFVARKLHTESEKGAMLDSAADLLFAIIYAVKILPHLPIPLWIWIWIAIIAMIKTAGIVWKSSKERKLAIEHSVANKLTGFLVFLLPLTIRMIDVKYTAGLACTAATFAAMEEICRLKGRMRNEQI